MREPKWTAMGCPVDRESVSLQSGSVTNTGCKVTSRMLPASFLLPWTQCMSYLCCIPGWRFTIFSLFLIYRDPCPHESDRAPDQGTVLPVPHGICRRTCEAHLKLHTSRVPSLLLTQGEANCLAPVRPSGVPASPMLWPLAVYSTSPLDNAGEFLWSPKHMSWYI